MLGPPCSYIYSLARDSCTVPPADNTEYVCRVTAEVAAAPESRQTWPLKGELAFLLTWMSPSEKKKLSRIKNTENT